MYTETDIGKKIEREKMPSIGNHIAERSLLLFIGYSRTVFDRVYVLAESATVPRSIGDFRISLKGRIMDLNATVEPVLNVCYVLFSVTNFISKPLRGLQTGPRPPLDQLTTLNTGLLSCYLSFLIPHHTSDTVQLQLWHLK